jgi:hypothetical protein
LDADPAKNRDTGPKIMDSGKEAENIRNPCGSKV